MSNDTANNMTDTIHQLEKELKDLQEENKVLISECDRLIKEKGRLLKKSELITEYERLLKAAVEDFSYCSGIYGLCYYNIGCDVCADCNNTPCDEFQWRYADEALKLIEDEPNGI